MFKFYLNLIEHFRCVRTGHTNYHKVFLVFTKVGRDLRARRLMGWAGVTDHQYKNLFGKWDYLREEIYNNSAPCGGRITSWEFSFTPRFFCRQRSRTFCGPVNFNSDHATLTVATVSPRLNKPTALEPSSSRLA